MRKMSLKNKLNPLKSRQIRHLFIARSISTLGDMVTPIALVFAILEFSDSASALGIILAARAIPSVVLLLFGGVIGDKYNRKMILVISSLVGFISQGLIGILLLTGEATVLNIAMLTAVRGGISSFFNPAFTGAVSAVAPNEKKQEVFSLFAITNNISEIAGPALAGVSLLYINPSWLLIGDSLTFLISAILIFTCGKIGTPKNSGFKTNLLFKEMNEGLKYVLTQKWLTALIISASVFQLFLLSSMQVLGPVVAERHLGGAPDWALISISLGIGSLVGSLLAMYYKPNKPLLVAYSLLILGAGPTLLLLAIPAPLYLLVISEFVAGIVISFFSTLEATTITKIVPNHLLSRVDSINRFGSISLKPVGLALIGPLSLMIGIKFTLIIATIITLLAILWPLTIVSVRQLTTNEIKIEHEEQTV